jgi:DNA processing protein
MPLAPPRLISPVDPAYPQSLNDLRDPPRELYAIGDLSLLERPLVAIVGTRNASPYGVRTTRALAGALARGGGVIVSGLARGIDTAAHAGALDAQGATIAILGSGADVAYPVTNRGLHERIGNRGLILSELPPGAHPHKGSFPKRNRLIAAIAKVTIIVEAGPGSGALLTANHALELARPLAAVPGPIDDDRHAGSNTLLRDGAVVISNIDDALAIAGLRQLGASTPSLRGDELLIWNALGACQDLDGLVAAVGVPPRRCLAALTSLEISGFVECTPTGDFRRRH